MRGDLALEFIFRIAILLVVVIVVVALILKFSDQIQKMVSDFIKQIFGEKAKSKFPENKEKNSFSSAEVATYIDSCYSYWTSLEEVEQEDKVCYVLLSKIPMNTSVTKEGILERLNPTIKNKVDIKTDFSLPYLSIRFESLGDRIIVS